MPNRNGGFTLADGLGLARGIIGLQENQRRAQTHGLGMKMQTARLEEYERQQKESGEVNSLVDNYSQMAAEGKSIPVPKTKVEMIAQGKFYDGYAKTEEGRLKKAAADKAELQRQYENFRPYATEAMRHIQSGDFKAARPYIEEASKVAPIPYRYIDDESGFLVEQFRPDSTGKWEDVRHVTEEEAGQALSQIMRGEQVTGNGIHSNPIFMQIGERARTATARSNAQNWSDPSRWKTFKDKNGDVFRAVPTASREDWNQSVGYVLMDQQGNILRNKPKEPSSFKDKFSSTEKVQNADMGTFSMQELLSHGLQPEDLDRDKKILENQKITAAMGLEKAKTAKARAEAGKVYSDMKVAGAKKPIKISLGDQQTVYNKLASSLNPKLEMDPITGNAPSDPAMEKLTIAVLNEMQSGIPFLQARDMVLDEIKRSRQPGPAKGHPANGRVSGPDKNIGNNGPGKSKAYRGNNSAKSGSDLSEKQRPEGSENKNYLDQYKGTSVVDKDGTLWGKDAKGRVRRILRKPSKKIYNGRYENPDYKKYLDTLEYLGIKQDSKA
ncbi:hypothetical protein [Maridesulfovibrio bastinii]|uniref:hypothetical protein n=1 Tax=Maridesulfovibrio bastinii TaxID=47157 RepID=UPI00047FFAD5|nr:hypothetical protein [Maridesulfovibrio bastinii]